MNAHFFVIIIASAVKTVNKFLLFVKSLRKNSAPAAGF